MKCFQRAGFYGINQQAKIIAVEEEDTLVKRSPSPQVFPTIVASIRKGVFASMLFTLPD